MTVRGEGEAHSNELYEYSKATHDFLDLFI